jgi:hypothetical protein
LLHERRVVAASPCHDYSVPAFSREIRAAMRLGLTNEIDPVLVSAGTETCQEGDPARFP